MRLLILLPFALLLRAQTAPPPYLLPSLPANVSQALVTSGSNRCNESDITPVCTQFAGSNAFLVKHGASGGIHYDSGGNLFIGVPTDDDAADQQISAIFRMTPSGTFTEFLSAPPALATNCTLLSPTSALINNGASLLYLFSVNPISNALEVVTSNAYTLISWNPTQTTGACVDGVFTGAPPLQIILFTTYALIELTGSGI
jgi:hypothetical protein